MKSLQKCIYCKILFNHSRLLFSPLKSRTKMQASSTCPEKTVTIDGNELKIFDETFETLRSFLNLAESKPELKKVYEWFDKNLVYNVPHGKKTRGLAVEKGYSLLLGNKASDDKLKLCRIVGWCIELLQAYFLVLDDIMDQSSERRGQVCWYLKKDVGLIAINDALMLRNAIFTILKKYLRNDANYLNIVHLFMEMDMNTCIGQTLDLLSSINNENIDFDKFTMEQYLSIAKYKTAYYSFSLPIRSALYLSGINNEETHKAIEEVLLKIGQYFQIQDDFLDCFGDPKVIGKIGTDIEEGKCCWPVVIFLKKANQQQKDVLRQNYGKKDPKCTETVKKLYKELEIEKDFFEYEQKSYVELESAIEAVSEKHKLPKALLQWILNKIYKRSK